MLLVLAMLMVTGSVYGVVEASYDGGEELILIERYPLKYEDRIQGNYSFTLYAYPMSLNLYSIYWNPKYFDSLLQSKYIEDPKGLIYINNRRYTYEPGECDGGCRYRITNQQYYYVKDGSRLIKTNNIRYKLDPKRVEKTLAGFPLDNELVYAGYISSNERFYIHRTTKEQFIKVLEPITDPIVVLPIVSGYGNLRYREYRNFLCVEPANETYRLQHDGTYIFFED
ncbi:MAG: hypothetical protein ACRCWI_08785 [Brevinema sp.]